MHVVFFVWDGDTVVEIRYQHLVDGTSPPLTAQRIMRRLVEDDGVLIPDCCTYYLVRGKRLIFAGEELYRWERPITQ